MISSEIKKTLSNIFCIYYIKIYICGRDSVTRT
jgi:hypothetical protein